MTDYTPKDISRFWKKVDRRDDPDACWEWITTKGTNRYGHIRWRGPVCIASRVVYEITFGPISADLKVLHKCDNPPCVNPRHLYLGTQKNNAADREARGRGNRRPSPGEKNGQCKVSDADVAEIRRLYAEGYLLQREIALLFNLCQQQVSNIVRRKRRK